MDSFSTIILRNFIGTGLPFKQLYIIITYYSLNYKIIKSLRSYTVKPKDDFEWKKFEFEIQLSREELYNGEIIIELYSKEFIKNKLIGNIKLNIIDDLFIENQFNKSYIPFNLNGQAKYIHHNICSTLNCPYNNRISFINNNNNKIQRKNSNGAQLDYFIGITGHKFTCSLLLDNNIQNLHRKAIIIASMSVFLKNLSENIKISPTTIESMVIDGDSVDYYMKKGFYDIIKSLFKESNIIREEVFNIMFRYQSSDRNYCIKYEKIHDLSFDGLIQSKKQVIEDLYQYLLFISKIPMDNTYCEKRD
jgi:hypothetical protein